MRLILNYIHPVITRYDVIWQKQKNWAFKQWHSWFQCTQAQTALVSTNRTSGVWAIGYYTVLCVYKVIDLPCRTCWGAVHRPASWRLCICRAWTACRRSCARVSCRLPRPGSAPAAESRRQLSLSVSMSTRCRWNTPAQQRNLHLRLLRTFLNLPLIATYCITAM